MKKLSLIKILPNGPTGSNIVLNKPLLLVNWWNFSKVPQVKIGDIICGVSISKTEFDSNLELVGLLK